MSCSLMQAILFSSRSQAYLDIKIGSIVADYRIVVAHLECGRRHDEGGDNTECYAIRIYRVFYQDGRKVIADNEHKLIIKDTKDQLENYFIAYDIAIDGAWMPVEMGEVA